MRKIINYRRSGASQLSERSPSASEFPARRRGSRYGGAPRDGASRGHIRRIKKDSWEVWQHTSIRRAASRPREKKTLRFRVPWALAVCGRDVAAQPGVSERRRARVRARVVRVSTSDRETTERRERDAPTETWLSPRPLVHGGGSCQRPSAFNPRLRRRATSPDTEGGQLGAPTTTARPEVTALRWVHRTLYRTSAFSPTAFVARRRRRAARLVDGGISPRGGLPPPPPASLAQRATETPEPTGLVRGVRYPPSGTYAMHGPEPSAPAAARGGGNLRLEIFECSRDEKLAAARSAAYFAAMPRCLSTFAAISPAIDWRFESRCSGRPVTVATLGDDPLPFILGRAYQLPRRNVNNPCAAAMMSGRSRRYDVST